MLARWLAWTPPAPGAAYRPQLDGLRAVAVLLVLYSHFWDEASNAGLLGVRLFFVLSGFLITGMLLEARDAGGSSLGHFYIRRALRLWPAYYLTLGLAVLVDAEGIRDVAWWHVLYGTNILFALRGDYVPWYTAAWWSLAAEEQFYIAWPLLVLLVPRRWLGTTCALLILLSLAFSGTVEASGGEDNLYGLLPAVLDSLAAGALLSVIGRARPERLGWLRPAGWAGLAGWAVVVAGDFGRSTWASLPLLLLFPALVWFAANDSAWWPGRLLSWRPLTFVGRISYGIYLYHLPLWWCAMQWTESWRIFHRGPVVFVVMTAATLAVATLSWFALEAPLNRLKRRFPFP